MIKLLTPLTEIKGIGLKFADSFAKLDLFTVRDLLWYFPSRYEDFSSIRKIIDVSDGEQVTIQGVIEDINVMRTWKRRMFIVEATVADETGSLRAVWFNQKFLLSVLKRGKAVNLAGKVLLDPKKGFTMTHPSYELINTQISADIDSDTLGSDFRPSAYIDSDELRFEPDNLSKSEFDRSKSALRHTGRLVPIYPETKKVTSKMIRYGIGMVFDNLGEMEESFPSEILEKEGLPDINTALKGIHFPETIAEARLAKSRFVFEDLFLLQLANLRERQALAKSRAYSFPLDSEYVKSILGGLPFSLTRSQEKVLWEILEDLSNPFPMNRLLQGDVGSGKTIVAAVAGLVAARDGKQIAFMAPTEVLARQHYQTLKKFFPFFESGIGLLTSGEAHVFFGEGLESEITKSEFVKKVERGEILIVAGTHALIQRSIEFNQLGLVVVDEQHRFGVRQRASLARQNNNDYDNDKNQESSLSSSLISHFLSMSATPIPRTLSLTVFGDLNLSIIDEMPLGRKEIVTKIVAPANREKAYAFIRGQVHKGRQAFVICPRIDADTQINSDGARNYAENLLRKSASSEHSSALFSETKAVKEEYEKLKKKVFPDLNVGMLHGKMKSKEKESIMREFKNGKIDVLVSTSVIEVGVDVSNATIMMIEGSERFGLAQLYQFRGRVGRGEYQSFCFLFADSSGKATHDRLAALLTAKNGFELAEKDLAIRGPGEFLGYSQTGVPDLAMKAIQNPDLVSRSRAAAEKLLQKDPELNEHIKLRERVEAFRKEVHLE